MAEKKQKEHAREAEPKSYAERIDPGGATGRQAEGLTALAASPFGRVLRWLGVNQETLEQAKESTETYRRLVAEPDRIASALAPLGWIFHGLAHLDAYGAAATLVEQGKVEEAEDVLVATYSEDDHAFIRFYRRVVSLYQGDERRRQIGLARSHLLDEAFELHKAGHYAGAIPIVLAQIDGIFIDMTSKPAKYFYDPKNPHLVDEVTIAGHPQGLKALSELMSEGAYKTVVTDRLTRQGIVHGRVLRYDTLRNSTKVWAALLAVIEAVGPRAQELNEKAAEEHERRFTGSREVDEWGMRLDRRGFDEAHEVLNRVHLYQHGHLKNHGRFAPDQHALDPTGELLRVKTLELQIIPTAEGYYAWVGTPPGVFFALAAHDDDFNNYWIYVAEEPPAGGVDEDAGWQHILEADYSDW